MRSQLSLYMNKDILRKHPYYIDLKYKINIEQLLIDLFLQKLEMA